MSTVAVVGNGFSAAGKGAEIDRHDFVVRCNIFWLCGAKDVGKKMNALAWFGCMGHPKNMGPGPQGDFTYWVTRACNPIKPVIEEKVRLTYNIIWAAQGKRSLRFVTEELWTQCRDYLNAQPTTGFMAVAMALAGYAGFVPDLLTIYGFECLAPGGPGWGYPGAQNAGCPSMIGIGDHDHFAEKRAFKATVLEGKWLGQPHPTKLLWPNMREVPV